MKFRSIIFWSHLISGVIAGVVILVMSVTGALLAFETQIVEWAERDIRNVTPPSSDAQRLSLNALAAKAREANPDSNPTALTLRPDSTASVVVGFGREATVCLNPWTGDVLKSGSKTRDFMRSMENLHRWLGTTDKNRPIGKAITGACNFAFFFLAASGLYIWWPRNWSRNALRPSVWFVGGLRGKARDWNWHNVIGLWCAPVLIILTFTGGVMSYQWANNLIYRITGNEPPAPFNRAGAPAPASSEQPKGDRRRERMDADKEGKQRQAASLDTLFAKAEQQVPGWRSISLRLPQRADAPVSITIQEPPAGLPNPRSQLTLDAFTADVVKWEPFFGQNSGRKLRTWVRFLHTGEAGRLPGQFIAMFACAGGAVLVWTGFAMSWRRFFGRKTATISNDTKAQTHELTIK